MKRNYKVRIEATDVVESAAMDVNGYSHMTPASHGNRFVIFASTSKVQAQADVETALGGLFRVGKHQVIQA